MNVLPTIVYFRVMPQWVTVSRLGAYYPADRMIYLRYGVGLGTLFHEIGHHLIELLGGGPVVQRLYDRVAAWLEGVDRE